MKKKSPDVIPIFLMVNDKKVKCRICKHEIETGRSYKKSNNKYVYKQHHLRPIALSSMPDKRGIYRQRFIHSECAHITFGDLRRAKTEGKSVNELLGNIVMVEH